MSQSPVNNGTPWPPQDGPKYLVSWMIYIHAPNETIAAQRALETIRTTNSALKFACADMRNDEDEPVVIDLS